MEIKEWLESYAQNLPVDIELSTGTIVRELEFAAACMDSYGIVLTGTQRHCCPDWDLLPIDETCEEIKACICDR